MATKDTVVQELVVNTLTQAQFDAAKEAGTLNPYELYGTPDTGGGSIGNIDNLTITANTDNEIQAVAVIDQNTGIVKTWTGTIAEYSAIATKDPETEYIITDDIGGPATVIAELAEGLNGKADVSTVAHVVTEFQAPTAENNYTWYRKYNDGWVEQGGSITLPAIDASFHTTTITLLIEMASSRYNVCDNGGQIYSGVSGASQQIAPVSSTTIQIARYNMAQSLVTWQVCGMAA